jgi:hypothetical protein
MRSLIMLSFSLYDQFDQDNLQKNSQWLMLSFAYCYQISLVQCDHIKRTFLFCSLIRNMLIINVI